MYQSRILKSPNLNNTIYFNALQILKIKFKNFNFENKIDDLKKLIDFMINKINTINELKIIFVIIDFLADNALNEEIIIDDYKRDKFISNY